MSDFIEFIQNNISTFDLTVFLIVIYSMAHCAAKGFMRSLLSFSKWLLALVITIILVPKFIPFVRDYVESKFIADIGLGIFIYIMSLFIIINIGTNIIVIIKASSHFENDNKLLINPFAEQWAIE